MNGREGVYEREEEKELRSGFASYVEC